MEGDECFCDSGTVLGGAIRSANPGLRWMSGTLGPHEKALAPASAGPKAIAAIYTEATAPLVCGTHVRKNGGANTHDHSPIREAGIMLRGHAS